MIFPKETPMLSNLTPLAVSGVHNSPERSPSRPGDRPAGPEGLERAFDETWGDVETEFLEVKFPAKH